MAEGCGRPNGVAPAQGRQAGVIGKGAGADDRVVAPVIALRAVPPGDAVRDQRSVEAAGELLHARKQSVAADDDGQGLDQADAGCASIAAASRTMLAPSMTLSASSVIICG